MRLTLRTLLAYMDDMLDPSDQEELGRKIEASPFATELIHRSRDAVRRLRLSAPEPLAGESEDLHGGDRNLDANTAAEYLDSILSPDDVAEFERSCLEAGPNADMLLAEAVSCHHILTLVLGEPAEVDADMRQRMYEIVQHSAPVEAKQVRIEPAHKTPTLEPASATPSAPLRAARRPAVDPDESAVPDYMREAARIRRGEKRRIAAVVLAAALGGVVTYLVMSTKDAEPPKELAKMGDEEALTAGVEIGAAAPVESPATTGEAAADEDGGGAAPAFDPRTTASEAAPAEPATEVEQGADQDTAGAEPTAETTAPPVAVDVPPVVAETAPVVEPATPVTEPMSDVGAGTADDPGTPPAIPSPTESAVIEPQATAAASPDHPFGSPPVDPVATPPVAADPGAIAAADPAAAAAPEGAEGEAADAEVADDQPRQLGAYLGNEDLLLRFDPATSAWLRLPPRSALAAGDRLLVLPAFRTHVVLGQDVNAFIGGGTEITLTTAAEAASDAAADFGLAIPFGRVILNSGASGNRIALVLGDETRVIALGPSSSIAINVERRFVPGRDPQQEPYPLEVSYFLTTGSAEWGDGGEGQSAEGEASWTTIDGADSAPQSIAELPPWINSESLTGLDESARDVVEEALAAGQPATIPLLELTDPARRGKRIEVRGLAGKSAAYIGEFEPLVNSLSDMNERPRWKERVETLRAAVARDPESLERIFDALSVQLGEKAAGDLTEMLLGFDSEDVGTTKEEVQDGALVRLINWLDDEDLSYRVLASYNINEITGTTSLGGYRPEHVASKRKGEIRFYWDRLEKGDLTPREWLATGWAPR